MREACALFAIVIAVAGAVPAGGHGSSDHTIRVQLAEDRLSLSLVLGRKDLALFDHDGDGVLTRGEFDAHRDAIVATIDRCLDGTDADGALTAEFSDQPIAGYADLGAEAPIVQMRILRRYRIAGEAGFAFGCFLSQHAQRNVDVLEDGQIARRTVTRKSARLSF